MALTYVQQNLASEMQSMAEEIISIKNRLAVIGAMFLSEGMATIAEADLQALPPFAHVTVGELVEAKNAIGILNTSLGEYVQGTPIAKLTKIVGRVPK